MINERDVILQMQPGMAKLYALISGLTVRVLIDAMLDTSIRKIASKSVEREEWRVD